MKRICGMTINKSFENNIAPGKRHTKKRTKGKFHKEDVHCPDGNSGRSLWNTFNEENNRPELKIEIPKIDVSKKIKPDWKDL